MSIQFAEHHQVLEGIATCKEPQQPQCTDTNTRLLFLSLRSFLFWSSSILLDPHVRNDLDHCTHIVSSTNLLMACESYTQNLSPLQSLQTPFSSSPFPLAHCTVFVSFRKHFTARKRPTKQTFCVMSISHDIHAWPLSAACHARCSCQKGVLACTARKGDVTSRSKLASVEGAWAGVSSGEVRILVVVQPQPCSLSLWQFTSLHRG